MLRRGDVNEGYLEQGFRGAEWRSARQMPGQPDGAAFIMNRLHHGPQGLRIKSQGRQWKRRMSAALSKYLGIPAHTLFQVSTSGALVAGVYDREVSVKSILEHGGFRARHLRQFGR